MNTVPCLHKGDKVGIVAPARKITEKELRPALALMDLWQLKPVFGRHLFGDHHQFSGTVEERTADLQEMLDDKTIKAVWCARGGYGTVQVIDRIDFRNFINHPKWIIGYSDITVLHSHIQNNLGIPTLHATMPVNIEENNYDSIAVSSLKHILFDGTVAYRIPQDILNRQGTTEGKLIGGNLSVLYSLLGSSSDIQTENAILFIEDLDEYLYHIDRMMMNLKRNGKLDKLAGLIVGGMEDMHDNTVAYGKDAKEIIVDAVREYDYPVCFDFPSGHIKNNHALVLGVNYKMEVGKDGVHLSANN